MGRIIDNYAAYEVSPDIIARDIARERDRALAAAAKEREQAQWMAEQMEIIRAEMEGRPIPKPQPKPQSDAHKTLKRCIRCQRELPLSFFYKDRRRADELSVYCKVCNSELRRLYRKSAKT